MSTALQCPSCGFAHRLDAVGDASVFRCARCSRLLKVPDEYRTRSPGGPTTGGATSGAPPRTQRSRRVAPPTRGPRRSVRILIWVIAFVLGGLVLVRIAKWTGFFGGNDLVDLLLDNSLRNYLRLAALVPVWGLLTAAIATLFLEGPRWYRRRKAGASRAPATPVAEATPARPTETPTRVPTRTAAPAAPVVAPARAAGPAGPGDDEFAVRAAAGQRPRRIPRRDAGV